MLSKRDLKKKRIKMEEIKLDIYIHRFDVHNSKYFLKNYLRNGLEFFGTGSVAEYEIMVEF